MAASLAVALVMQITSPHARSRSREKSGDCWAVAAEAIRPGASQCDVGSPGGCSCSTVQAQSRCSGCPCCVTPQAAARIAKRQKKHPQPERSRAMTRLGFCRLPGYSADVWGHAGYAYVGSEGSGKNAGVAVVSLADPRHPRLLRRIAGIAGTTQEDVMVARVNTPAFHGDLLATGIQVHFATDAGPRGLDLWDVTNPRQPKHLAFWPSGDPVRGVARGVHELYLFARGDHAYVAGMVPESEERGGPGDFRLIDVSDPRKPVQIADWGAVKDGDMHFIEGDHYPWGHSATVNAAGTLAAVSFWDGGIAFLDLSDPAHPREAQHIWDPSGPAGNTHSASFSADEGLMLVSDENLKPQGGPFPWGILRTWDVSNLQAPAKLGQFGTQNALLNTSGFGLYSVHNSIVRGKVAYTSWYSDGVRAIDISNPAAPREIGFYSPPNALVWGIHEDGGRVLASDINAGLYVLKPKR